MLAYIVQSNVNSIYAVPLFGTQVVAYFYILFCCKNMSKNIKQNRFYNKLVPKVQLSFIFCSLPQFFKNIFGKLYKTRNPYAFKNASYGVSFLAQHRAVKNHGIIVVFSSFKLFYIVICPRMHKNDVSCLYNNSSFFYAKFHGTAIYIEDFVFYMMMSLLQITILRKKSYRKFFCPSHYAIISHFYTK